MTPDFGELTIPIRITGSFVADGHETLNRNRIGRLFRYWDRRLRP